MQSDAFQDVTAALARLGGQRVWSLLVSVFGDLAQARGEAIDGPVLSAIMSEMGIRPEATRVALHRLRNDGWIASEKSGRTSRHSLTALGRTESAAASPRIYGTPVEDADDWHMVLTENGDANMRAQMHTKGFVLVMPRLYIGAASATPPNDAMVLTGETVPDWLRAQITPQNLTADYEALAPILADIDERLPRSAGISPLQSAVLRCLIVHNWRRIALKHPRLPRILYPDNWAGTTCHVLVARLLDRFPRPHMSQITGP